MFRYILAVLIYSLVSANASAVTPRVGWEDSYSADGQCYCASTFDHDAGELVVETPAGPRTTLEICTAIGPGPGIGDNPIYNDLQCGNGPPNNAGDEQTCPGRVDIGEEGCFVIGPTWNLERYFPAAETTSESETTPEPTTTPESETTSEPQTTPESEAPSAEEVTSEAGTDVTDVEIGESDVSEPDPESVYYDATSFSSKDDRWVVVDAQGIRAQANGSEEQSVSVNSYLEVQPDSKVDQADPVTTDNVWVNPGTGPLLQFDVTLDQAGRYQVYVRTFSVGEYDEGVSVGFDGIWTESDNALDTCNTRNRWTWSNCDDRAAVVLDIPTNGAHTIQFSALNDGVEIDQFALRLIETTGDSAEPDLANAVTVGGGVGFGSGSLSLFPELSFLLIMVLIGLGRPACRLLANANSNRLSRNDSREKNLRS